MEQVPDSNIPRQERRMRSADVILVLLLAGILFALVLFDWRDIVSVLYSPTAGLLLVVMIVEFLALKSTDRTRILRLEMARLKKSRLDDEKLLRRAQDLVSIAVDGPLTEEEGRAGDWRGKAKDLIKDIRERL